MEDKFPGAEEVMELSGGDQGHHTCERILSESMTMCWELKLSPREG